MNLMFQNNALTDEYNRLLNTKQCLKNNESLIEKKISDILVSLKEQTNIDQRLIFTLRKELLRSRNNNIYSKNKSKLFSKTEKNKYGPQKIRSTSNLKMSNKPLRNKEPLDILLNQSKGNSNNNYAPEIKINEIIQHSEQKYSAKRRNIQQDPRVLQFLIEQRKAKSVLKLFPAVKIKR